MIIPWVFLFFLFCNKNVLGGSSLNDEGIALLSFKNSINEDPEGSLTDWNSTDENPCSWNGITCKQGKVISVSIPNKKLSGLLDSGLGNLSSLRHVNLRNNKFYGTLPFQLFNVQGLQSLVLYGNSFSGSIPSEIGNLKYLQSLDLSQNFMNGSIPKSVVECKRLRTLILRQNNFTGSLPVGFGLGLISLEKLDLSFNEFSGSIPSDMGNLSSLQGTVDLSHNHFSGSIPSSLGNLPEKVYIDLTYNNLSGPIPQSGALENRGPTAFVGNPSLCGPPLRNPCPSGSPGAGGPSSIPFLPGNSPSSNVDNGGSKGRKNKGLSKNVVIAIVASDIVGICLIGLLFSYCFWKFCSCKKKKNEIDGNIEKGSRRRKKCLCFKKDESDSFSDSMEQSDLVPLDVQLGFDLDELLKASAFVLGKSGIGIVYKVVLEDGLILAVRRLGEGGTQRFKEFQTEVEAIGKIRHPNIVTLKAYYWSIDEKLLIYEYIPNGNLSAALHGKAGMISFTPLSWSVRLRIMKGIAKGLAHLHEFSPKKYVHGDLKPNNILLGENMEPHISDFGLGRLANIAGATPTLQSNRIASEKQQQQTATSEVMSINSVSSLGPYYQAPEALKVVKPSQKWDVYSFGVILLEMVSGRSPMVQVGTTEMDLVRWVQLCIEEKKPLGDVLDPTIAREIEKEEEVIVVLKIALACVQTSPERRPSMRYISESLDRVVALD